MSGVEQTIYMGSEHLFAKMFPSRIRFDPVTPLIVSTRYTDLVSIACSTLTRRAQSFAGQIPRTVGEFQPRFQVLMEGINNAVDCGIRQRVFHTTEDWRLECEIAFSGGNTPRPLFDGDFDVVDQSANAPQWYEVLEYLSEPDSQTGLLHGMGETLDALGPLHLGHLRSSPEKVALGAHMIQVFSKLDESLTTLPLNIQASRMLKLMDKTRWPLTMAKDIKDLDQTYDDISQRCNLFSADKNLVRGVMESRMSTIILSEEYRQVSKLCRGTLAVTDRGMFRQLSRLMPVSIPSSYRISNMALEDAEGLTMVNDFLKLRRSTWEKEMNKGRMLDEVIGILLWEEETNAKAAPAANKSHEPGQVKKASNQELIELYNSQTFKLLEVNIEQARRKRYKNYEQLEIVMRSDCGYAIKVALGHITHTHKSVLKYIEECLAPGWEEYASLRMVWDGQDTQLSLEQQSFCLSSTFLKNLKKGEITELDILRDVHTEVRRQVDTCQDGKKYYDRDLKDRDIDSLIKYYVKYGGRAMAAIGFPSKDYLRLTAVDSFEATVEAYVEFIDAGNRLAGDQWELHMSYAWDFFKATRLECQKRTKLFLKANDPAHSHPWHYNENGARSSLVLAECMTNLHTLTSKYNRYYGNAFGSNEREHNTTQTRHDQRGKRKPSTRETEQEERRNNERRRNNRGGKGGKGGMKMEPPPAPHMVDIGALTRRDRHTGKAKVKVTETSKEISCDGQQAFKLDKEEAAKICDCGIKDKCWALVLSTLPWPLKLLMCNHSGEPAHERHDSTKHVFTKEQMLQLREARRRNK